MSFAPITEAQKKRVIEDINYDEAQMKNKIQQVKEWVRKQPHLPQLPDEILEKYLFLFLLGTKMSTERTKYKVDVFYAMRHQIPEIYFHRDPTQKDVRDSVDQVRFFPLSELTPDAIRVLILSYNPDKTRKVTTKNIKASYKRISAINDFRFQCGDFCRGEYFIFDGAGLFASHLTELPWLFMQKITALGQEALPLRVKAAFLVNAPPFLDTILNIFKPILTEKMKNRIQFVHNYDELYKYIPQRILPSDYGGDGPSNEESSRAWQKTVESMRDFLIEDSKRMTDESKRPSGSTNDCGQIFGIHGTFNKLNID
uniref:CRAL-TRIO domain-containing protein n=1 Tax=Graphocephala atropunctata TaxID=36148 RepID=A0A1B6LA26_9HEMI